MVSIIFGLLGIIVGLWAKNFEQLTMLVMFFITPLSFVGGVFNTVQMLPAWLRWIAWANPLFYFINGVRHSMIGVSEAPVWLGASVADRRSPRCWRLWCGGCSRSAMACENEHATAQCHLRRDRCRRFHRSARLRNASPARATRFLPGAAPPTNFRR